ncbi:MAG: S-adenosylmethionine-dependent methyltransferase [Bacteroidia bacterium]|nr:MAG: S-adenosylmethionine-dependent methyltransferase [Bacteroidia bacterium]
MESLITTTSPCLYLIPNIIGSAPIEWQLPENNKSIIRSLSYFIAEDLKSCRQLLKLSGYQDISAAQIVEYNEHNIDEPTEDFFIPMKQGHSIGLVSEAGCPVIADPGDKIVRWAHLHQINVVPLVGASSIMLAIMAAGLSGNNFAFNGYLPIETHERVRKIKELEQFSFHKKQAQFFIEAPYRNQKLLGLLINILQSETWLSIASNILSDSPIILTKKVNNWKRSSLTDIQKKPCVFGILKD